MTADELIWNAFADSVCHYIHGIYLEHFAPVIERATKYDDLTIAANELVKLTDVNYGHLHAGPDVKCAICEAREAVKFLLGG